MKRKILFFIMLGVYTALYSQFSYQLNIRVDDLIFEKYGDFDVIKLGQEYWHEYGKPQIPVVTKSFVIPMNASVTDMRVRIVDETKLEGEYYIIPVQPPQKIGEIRKDFVEPDSVIYNLNNVFPDSVATIASDRIVMGYHVVTVSFFPVSYIPLKKEVCIRTIAIDIDYLLGEFSSKPIESYNRSLLSKNFVKSIVENQEDVDLFSKNAGMRGNMYRSNMNNASNSINILDNITPDYVIITSDSLKESFSKLAAWKTKKGIPTVIKTIEEISEEYVGSDLPEKIRNYLLDVKTRWNTDGMFILLGGDVNVVPARMSRGDEGMCASDSYFIADALNIWSPRFCILKVTYTTPFFFGRIPVKNKRETENFIAKLLSYEKADKSNVDYSYFNNSLITCAYLKTSQKINDNTRKEYTFFESGYMTELYNYTQGKNNNFWYLFDHFFCRESDHEIEFFDRNKGDELNRSNFLTMLQEGNSTGQFHFVYHVDHSYPTNMGTSHLDKGEKITNEDIDNLVDMDYPKIIMSGGCHPASFSHDCIAEHFLLKPKGGAVAFIGNTDVGYFPEYAQLEKFLNSLYSINAESTEQYSIGFLFKVASGFYKNKQWKLHLLGDPTMPVWTATPKNLYVTVTPDQVVSGENQITVEIKNLPSGQPAMICLMKEGEAYATRLVYDNEPQTFTFAPKTSGMLDITVTSHNYRPFETTIPVFASQESPEGYIYDISIDDTDTGNGNGQIDAGETVKLNVRLKNGADVDLPGVDGTLYYFSQAALDFVDIIENKTYFIGAEPGGILNSYTPFVIHIDKDAPNLCKNDVHGMRFILELENGYGKTYTDTIKLDILAPELKIGNQEFVTSMIPEVSGIRINLMNVGKGDAMGLTASLLPNGSDSNVSSCRPANISFPNIKQYETKAGYSSFNYYTKEGYQPGDPLKMKLVVKNKYGRTWNFDIDPTDRHSQMNTSTIKFRSENKAIELYWYEVSNVSGYDVYRSENGKDGAYTKLNNIPLLLPYYRDENVNSLHTYYYKVRPISLSGNWGELSEPVMAVACLPLMDNFPVPPKYRNSHHSITVADVNNDGYKEIVLVGSFIRRNETFGLLSVVNYKGRELLYGNTRYSGIYGLPLKGAGNPAIGNMSGTGKYDIITATWDDDSNSNMANAFSIADNENLGMKELWQSEVGTPYYRGPVIANIDNSPDESMEIILRSNARGPIKILDKDGNLRYGFEDLNGYSRPAVADLDGDGDMEIIAGRDIYYEDPEHTIIGGGGLYIWHHDGAPFGDTNPIFGSGISLCSPVVCDLNRDGKKRLLLQKTRRRIALFLFLILKEITFPDGRAFTLFLIPMW